VRLRPYLEMTVDEYWSRVMGVYFAVEVAVVSPIVMVVASMTTLIVNRIRFRFMLLLIFRT